MPSWGKIIVIGIGAVCAWPSMAGAAVQGYVLDRPLGGGVAGAKVVLYSTKDTVITNAKGWFTFDKATRIRRNPAGAAPVAAWDRSELRLFWPAARGARVDIRLSGLDGRERARLFRGAWLGAEGRLALPRLPAGVYVLRLRGEAGRFDLPVRVSGGARSAWGAGPGDPPGALAKGASSALPVLPPLPIDSLILVDPPILVFTDTVSVGKKGYFTGIFPVTLTDTNRLSLGNMAYSGKKKVAAGDGRGAFWMDSAEVTVSQYGEVRRALALAKSAAPIIPIDPFPLPIPITTLNFRKPITGVTKADAMLYCNRASKAAGLDTVYTYSYVVWDTTATHAIRLNGLAWDSSKAGVRLPDWEEWRRAYAAGGITNYYWGSAFGAGGDYAWYQGNSSGKAQVVAQKKPNADTLYDMAGNAAEWVQTDTSICLIPGVFSCSQSVTANMAVGGGYQDSAAALKRDAFAPMTGLGGSTVVAGDDIGFRTVINAPSRVFVPCLRCIDPIPVLSVLPSLP